MIRNVYLILTRKISKNYQEARNEFKGVISSLMLHGVNISNNLYLEDVIILSSTTFTFISLVNSMLRYFIFKDSASSVADISTNLIKYYVRC